MGKAVGKAWEMKASWENPWENSWENHNFVGKATGNLRKKKFSVYLLKLRKKLPNNKIP